MVSKTFEFTADEVPGWNNYLNRWVALEIFLTVIGLGAIVYMEYHNKDFKFTKKRSNGGTQESAQPQSEGARGQDYIDNSEDLESEMSANDPPAVNEPGRLAPTATVQVPQYDLIHEFWLLMFFHAVSLICGMRHSAQVLTVIFAYIHFLAFAAYAFFHVSYPLPLTPPLDPRE